MNWLNNDRKFTKITEFPACKSYKTTKLQKFDKNSKKCNKTLQTCYNNTKWLVFPIQITVINSMSLLVSNQLENFIIRMYVQIKQESWSKLQLLKGVGYRGRRLSKINFTEVRKGFGNQKCFSALNSEMILTIESV